MIDLVLTGNGPGELAGWVRPVARAARGLAHEKRIDLRLTMALTPSQFASGREAIVLGQWDLFDRILLPAETVKLTIGIGRVGPPGAGALVHLGGDIWFSARLAGRFGLPACAVAETTLISRKHRPFSHVFATSEQVAEQLTAAGVPHEKVLVTGDPRVDAVETGMQQEIRDAGFVVSFMPGSRDYLFKALAPYFLRIASRLWRRDPSTNFQIVVSPFLTPEVVRAARAELERRWSALPVTWIMGEPWPALHESDFVITVPGTNTVELAAAGIPFAVVAPAEMLDHLRLEGLANWITHLPLLGRSLKRALALRMLTNLRFIALPNQRAGRIIAPEWVGTWPDDAFVTHVLELLQDGPRRLSMRRALKELYAEVRGASRRIAERSLALAGGVVG